MKENNENNENDENKKYENAIIVRNLISREFNAHGNIDYSILFRFLDLNTKKDRKILKKNVKELIDICNKALEELEDK